MHLGHARTFWIAQQRARAANGKLMLRFDDMDRARCRPEFIDAFITDMSWLGLAWETPLIAQLDRLDVYRNALAQLHAAGRIYPCHRSRKELAETVSAPHDDGEADEPVFPIDWRPHPDDTPPTLENHLDTNWRFRVPEGTTVSFPDGAAGPQWATAGEDFGDFLVWRRDRLPSYQLACAVDDGVMAITEVVRGADLIKSTFRQILLLKALQLPRPDYYHAPLMTDENGERFAKRSNALSLQTLREQGVTPAEIIAKFAS